MASSSTNLGLEVSPPTIDDLLREYDMWVKTVDMCEDEFDLVTKTIALYRFAIKHYNEPGSELLLRAIADFEAAEAERRDPVKFSD
ncbi:hypothetical protein [Mycobacterium avium]|uniref:hypothetical protein n=1 Tax=Mycobacterium avium TaxID=1764 RepID=UPI000B07D116|nr:hypothetical protein [Mycobacterium avium]